MDEMRKYPRFEIDQMFELGFGRERQVPARGINISSGGMLCETGQRMEPYSRVFVLFSVPDRNGERMRCEAVIVRSDADGEHFETAMEFIELDDEDRARLNDYISHITEE